VRIETRNRHSRFPLWKAGVPLCVSPASPCLFSPGVFALLLFVAFLQQPVVFAAAVQAGDVFDVPGLPGHGRGVRGLVGTGELAGASIGPPGVDQRTGRGGLGLLLDVAGSESLSGHRRCVLVCVVGVVAAFVSASPTCYNEGRGVN